MTALGDRCFRATAVLAHHAAGCWPIQLVGSIVEHHVERWSMPQRIVVGFFVSELVLLWLRMRPQDRSASGWLHRLDGAAGLRMAKRVAGAALATRPAARERCLVWDPLARLCTRK